MSRPLSLILGCPLTQRDIDPAHDPGTGRIALPDCAAAPEVAADFHALARVALADATRAAALSLHQTIGSLYLIAAKQRAPDD